MRESRGALVMIGYEECAVGFHLLTGGELHVQSGGVIRPAAETPAVVARDRLTRLGRMSRSFGDTCCFRPAESVGAIASRARAGSRLSVRHRWDDTPVTTSRHNVCVASDLSYRERVLPGPAWWITVIALIAMLAIAYGVALGTAIGVFVAVIAAAISAAALWSSAPVIRVSGAGIDVARAQLPRAHWGDVLPLAAEDVVAFRRGQHSVVPITAYTVLPPWSPPAAVAILVRDSSDPHGAWVVGTRHPDRLARALSPNSPGS